MAVHWENLGNLRKVILVIRFTTVHYIASGSIMLQDT